VRRLASLTLLTALLAWPCLRLAAHVRLVHPSNSNPLRWTSPGNVSISIDPAGSDDISDGSTTTALQLAIGDWNALAGTTVQMVEVPPASLDWNQNSVHLITFDENNSSGFFPLSSPTVAITPVYFFSSGTIDDADVLFNGNGFAFTTSGVSGRFDIEDVAAHELGHLLGLDHSGFVGSTLYPYVDANLVLQRSLSHDEEVGMRDAYPAGSMGRITGTVTRLSGGAGVSGAYVVAVDGQGRTSASVLTGSSGAFTLPGLDPDTYTVYARPLDLPVSDGNLGSGHGTIEIDFEPAVYGSTATITATETIELGTLQVDADVGLLLGTPVDTFPLRLIAGQSRTVTIHGSGLVTGSTLSVSDPDLLLGTPVWLGSQVSVQVTTPGGEPRGHVDVSVTNPGGDLAILPAAFEITPPTPTVTGVVPSSGSYGGGTALTITGTGFDTGARIVIGDRIYTEGVDATLVDPTTFTLTTAATLAGTHDVVVIDASGVEGRDVAAFTALSAPTLSKVFPAEGAFAGGTEVILSGTNFVAGADVRINGVSQVVTDVTATQMRFTTLGVIAPGGPYLLEVENPDSAITTSAFRFVGQSDPVVLSCTPDMGPREGGTTITITGSSFTPTMEVAFVTDPAASPEPATAVTYVDANTLLVVTPAFAKGPAFVLVNEPQPGSGTFLEAGFTFTGGGGSSGGGCYTVPLEGPPSPGRWLELWWLAAVLAVLALRARRSRLVLSQS
jgi:hypothetical protein